MNLIGKTVTFKTGKKGVVVEQDNIQVKIEVEGEIKTLNLEIVISKGILSFDDELVQQEIPNFLEQLKQNKIERKESFHNDVAQMQLQKNRTDISGLVNTSYNGRFLKTDEIYDYSEVEKKHGINIAGFGRGINVCDDEIVLISNVRANGQGFIYHEKWDDNGDYLYIGEGSEGDQVLNARNMAIVNSSNDNKKIILYVKFSPSEYYYQGVFKFIEYKYINDESSYPIRNVYQFRLRRV